MLTHLQVFLCGSGIGSPQRTRVLLVPRHRRLLPLSLFWLALFSASPTFLSFFRLRKCQPNTTNKSQRLSSFRARRCRDDGAPGEEKEEGGLRSAAGDIDAPVAVPLERLDAPGPPRESEGDVVEEGGKRPSRGCGTEGWRSEGGRQVPGGLVQVHAERLSRRARGGARG